MLITGIKCCFPLSWPAPALSSNYLHPSSIPLLIWGFTFSFFFLNFPTLLGHLCVSKTLNTKKITLHFRKWRKQDLKCCCECTVFCSAQEEKYWTYPLKLTRAVAHFWGVCICSILVARIPGPLSLISPSPPLYMKWQWKEGRRDGFRALLVFSILFFPCLVLLKWQPSGTFFSFLKHSCAFPVIAIGVFLLVFP